jgi:FkbM family methyltransferase
MYSQNNEDEIFYQYFFEKKHKRFGVLIEIGANDGITFSNSRMLIGHGWNGHLIEPSASAFEKLQLVYKDQCVYHGIKLHNCAICNQDDDFMVFHESGSLIDKHDGALVSSLIEDEKKRWNGTVEFTQTFVIGRTWSTFCIENKIENFDLLSIDAEGMDLDIFYQINLDYHNVQMVCIEWNSKPELAEAYSRRAAEFNFELYHQNAENLIFVRK